MNSAELFRWILENLDYPIVTFFMMIESSFIPFPSEIIVPPAAWKASCGDGMNIFLVVIFATLGADIGSLINYYIARILGRPLIYKFADSRFGHLCLINREKVEKAEKYFLLHGNISTFIGRLIPAVRQLISLPAGLAKMRLDKFLLYTTLGALLWNSILASIGYFIYRFTNLKSIDDVYTQATKYSHVINYTILGVILLVILIFVLKEIKKKGA